MNGSLDISRRNLACHAIWGSGLFALFIASVQARQFSEDILRALLLGVCFSQLILSAGWVALARPSYRYRIVCGLLLAILNFGTLLLYLGYSTGPYAWFVPWKLIPFIVIAAWAFSLAAYVIFRVSSGAVLCHRDDLEKLATTSNRQLSVLHLVVLTFLVCMYLAIAKIFVPWNLRWNEVVFNDCIVHFTGAMIAALPLSIAILLPRPSGCAVPIAVVYAFFMIYIENYIYHLCTGREINTELGVFTEVILGTSFCVIVFCALARLSGYSLVFPPKTASPPTEAI